MDIFDLVIEYHNAFPNSLCDEIVERFESDDRKAKGQNGNYGPNLTTSKVSTDLYLSSMSGWEDIDERLYNLLTPYISQYLEVLRDNIVLDEITNIRDQGYQIQRTTPGGYFHWHNDFYTSILNDLRYINGNGLPCCIVRQRIFTYILYLNTRDTPDGVTEFKFGDSIKTVYAEKGKLLLFPPNPMCPHRGTVLDEGVKYLMTGWVTRDVIQDIQDQTFDEDREKRKRIYNSPEYDYLRLVDS